MAVWKAREEQEAFGSDPSALDCMEFSFGCGFEWIEQMEVTKEHGEMATAGKDEE